VAARAGGIHGFNSNGGGSSGGGSSGGGSSGGDSSGGGSSGGGSSGGSSSGGDSSGGGSVCDGYTLAVSEIVVGCTAVPAQQDDAQHRAELARPRQRRSRL